MHSTFLYIFLYFTVQSDNILNPIKMCNLTILCKICTCTIGQRIGALNKIEALV